MCPHDNTLMLSKSTGWIVDTKDPRIEEKEFKDGVKGHVYYYKVYRDIKAPKITDHPEYSPDQLVVHEKKTIKLKHMIGIVDLIILEVQVRTYRVKGLDSSVTCRDVVPFKVDGAMYTYHYKESIERTIKGYGMTIKRCAELCVTTPAIVRDINKKRLEKEAGDMRPTLADNIQHISVDEFQLTKTNIFCTIVICAETGKLLFLEPGKGKGQLNHFFQWVGDGFMKNVKTISMDMNGTYSSAIRDCAWKYPQLKIVYDKFHIIKYYNETVMRPVIKNEIDRLSREKASAVHDKDYEKATELANALSYIVQGKLLLLANRSTLVAKDFRNEQINKVTAELSKDGKGTYGKTTRRTDNEKRYQAILDSNEKLQNICRMREELQNIMKLLDEKELAKRLEAWIAEAQGYDNITQLKSFAKTMTRKWDGIITKARCKLENGRIEGINNFTKTLKRISFGLPDFDYLALLIWEQCESIRKRVLESKANTKQRQNKQTTPEKLEHKITKAAIRSYVNKTVFDWENNPAPDATPALKCNLEEVLNVNPPY